MTTMELTIDGVEYVAIRKTDLKATVGRLRKPSSKTPRVPLPPMEHGGWPAVAFALASTANQIIEDRESVGLTQAELARRAGIRVETLNRAERGQVMPETRTLKKIEKALKAAGLKREYL